jgi:LysM repeat protein
MPTSEPMKTYTVQDGDTLYDIAKKLGVSVDDLLALNNLANPNDLKLGQVLNVP